MGVVVPGFAGSMKEEWWLKLWRIMVMENQAFGELGLMNMTMVSNTGISKDRQTGSSFALLQRRWQSG
jgi:hypothetical protein